MKTIIALFILLFGAAALHAQADMSQSAAIEPQKDALAGQALDSKQADALESTLAKHPDDLSARTRLLGYYFRSRYSSAEARKNDRKHVLWIIKNRPEAKIAGLPFCHLDAIMDREGYDQAKQLWSEQTQAHSENTTILGNAAAFLFIHDKDLAEDLLKRAQKIEPASPHWSDQLGHLYVLEAGKENAAKALAEFEKAQAADDSELSRFQRLDSLAKSALDAGETEKASGFANELLKLAEKYPRDWNYGNAVQHGNSVLGSVALKKGNAKEAGQCLLKAGQTPGSPQLNSFGPNMTLAKELLESGEKEPVLEYFELCRKFWGIGGAKLDQWTKEVKAGKVPDFGANLLY